MEGTERIESWGVVEVMGHKKYAGYLSEQAIGGAALVRVDVPETEQRDGRKTSAYSKLIGPGSIYIITPTTEESARRCAVQIESYHDPIPVMLPQERQIAAVSSASREEPDAEFLASVEDVEDDDDFDGDNEEDVDDDEKGPWEDPDDDEVDDEDVDTQLEAEAEAAMARDITNAAASHGAQP